MYIYTYIHGYVHVHLHICTYMNEHEYKLVHSKYEKMFFFIMFIHTKKRQYNADTSLQERRQDKDMIIR
jgi:hypothetical protein